MKNRICHTIASAFVVMSVSQASAHAADKANAKQWIERGRYLVQVAGCNDCHTAGYAQSGGKLPEAQWLTGDSLGWRGPWGTTYPTNLRLHLGAMTEKQWLAAARKVESRPPMPWFALQQMTDDDLRAIHRFVKHLGAAGAAAPAYVPPDREPATPYVQFPMPPGAR